MEEIRFERVKYAPEGIKLPVRSTKDAAGYDFYCPYDVEIPPDEIVIIRTYVKAKFPTDMVLMIFDRSSYGIKRRLMLPNNVFIIDSDFYGNEKNDGNITIPVYNFGKETQVIKAGERFAQGVFTKFYKTIDDHATEVRKGGIGSTGR